MGTHMQARTLLRMHTHARMCGHACGLFCLEQVRQQLDSPEVEITLAVLKQAKRFHETTSFEADTGIKQACLPHSAMRRLSYFNSPARLSYFNSPARLSYFNSPARLFTRPATRATSPLGCTTWPHGQPGCTGDEDGVELQYLVARVPDQ